MQIEIDDELVERIKNVLGGDISQEALEGTIVKLIRDSVEEDEQKRQYNGWWDGKGEGNDDNKKRD